MKYENWEKVKRLVDQIAKEEKLLDEISWDNISVDIATIGYRIQSIGTWASSEHRLAELAKRFIDEVKADLKIRISKLKDELNEL
jgi:hypothetical protein